MRKLLIALAILVACAIAMLAAWIFDGRQLSIFIDRFGTIEITSAPIHSVRYEGTGMGGLLTINELRLSLDDTNQKNALSIGSTKDNQFAVARSGKVFALGPLTSTGENGSDYLAVVPQAGDEALFVTRRSALGWPTPFDFNFMTGHSPSWKRHQYYELRWKKSFGATLDMLWRYEQPFYGQQLAPGEGRGSGFGVHDGSTGLIKVEIRP